MRLEIAAGANPRKWEGWLRHDIRNFAWIDIICEWRNLVIFEGVDEIYSRHFIEHLPPEEGLEFLELCSSILRVGGIATILCPNMHWLCEKYILGRYSDSSEFVCWMFGGGDDEEWSYHKSGYDCDLLCRLMKQVGFGMFQVVSHEFLLEVRGVKI
jgi:predicted SAM-dependent methyltransferase